MLRLYTKSLANMLREATLPERPEHGGRSLTWLMGRWVRSRGVRRETAAYYYFSAAVSVPTTREAAWKTGRSWAVSSEGKSRGAGQDERGARVKRTKKRCETLKPLSHFDCCPECFSPAGGLRVLTQGVIYLSLSLSYFMWTFTLLAPWYPVSKGDYSVKLWAYPHSVNTALIGFGAVGHRHGFGTVVYQSLARTFVKYISCCCRHKKCYTYMCVCV